MSSAAAISAANMSPALPPAAANRHRGEQAVAQAQAEGGEGEHCRDGTAGLRRVAPFLPLMMCELREHVPEGPDWLHEVNMTATASRRRSPARMCALQSRRSRLDASFRHGARGAGGLDLPSVVLDGEAVVFDAKGVSNFAALVDALDSKTSKIVYLVFDVLQKDKRDLRNAPLRRRKEVLHGLLEGANSGTVRETSYIIGDGPAVFKKVVSGGAEGIISKRIDSQHRAGRGGQWVKVKDSKREDVVVIGWMPSERRRLPHWWWRRRRRKGCAMPGMSAAASPSELKSTLDKLKPLRLDHPPAGVIFEGKPPKGAVWVEPRHRIEVAFTEPTRDKRLRHPRFLGWREDRTDPPKGAAEPPPRKRVSRKSQVPRRAMRHCSSASPMASGWSIPRSASPRRRWQPIISPWRIASSRIWPTVR